jgi:hypothetical protein
MTQNIVFIMGGWSPNIGNAFFQLGGYQLIRTIIPDATFSFINEKPGYPQYWNPKGGNPKDYFDMASAIKSDYIILMGPIFRPEITQIWQVSLEKIKAQGTKIILLGVGAMNYDEINVNIYREFLKRIKPEILISRDKETFEKLGMYAKTAFNGIDLAFFIPDYYPIIGLSNSDPFVTFNFDKLPEPKITIFEVKSSMEKSIEYDKAFEFEGKIWAISLNKWRTKVARKSRYLMFLESVLFKGEQIKNIGGYPIIRTDHRYSPIIKKRTFRYPNVMVNDTPYPFFEIYGNTKLLLSNRLHACIISLAYGKPAMLFSESPRVRLMDRLNLNDIKDKPTKINLEYLENEKRNVKIFLSRILK